MLKLNVNVESYMDKRKRAKAREIVSGLYEQVMDYLSSKTHNDEEATQIISDEGLEVVVMQPNHPEKDECLEHLANISNIRKNQAIRERGEYVDNPYTKIKSSDDRLPAYGAILGAVMGGLLGYTASDSYTIATIGTFFGAAGGLVLGLLGRMVGVNSEQLREWYHEDHLNATVYGALRVALQAPISEARK